MIGIIYPQNKEELIRSEKITFRLHRDYEDHLFGPNVWDGWDGLIYKINDIFLMHDNLIIDRSATSGQPFFVSDKFPAYGFRIKGTIDFSELLYYPIKRM
jgi:hypothetical protein